MGAAVHEDVGFDRVGTIGARVRAARIAARLSQKQLADFSTLSVRAIRDIENGRVKRPRQDTLKLLMKALGLTGPLRDSLESPAHRDAFGEHPGSGPPVQPPVVNGPIIGRDDELATLEWLFDGEHRRLITITGIEGVGKTRLALELAHRLHKQAGTSILWVPLGEETQEWSQQHSSAAFISARIRALLEDGTDGAKAIGELIGDRETLLVLDGRRGSGKLSDTVTRLLIECPRLQVLITTRNSTGVLVESLFPLSPLPVPDADSGADMAMVAQVPSVQIFLTQVQQLRPTFKLTNRNISAIARICRSLDGLPTALALGARWTLIYSPQQLAQQLDCAPLTVSRLPEGGEWGGEQEVFHSVRRAVASLTPRQRKLLFDMSAHSGRWTMAEAAALTDTGVVETADDVYTLLMHGLLRRLDTADQTRFEVLNIVRGIRV